MTIKSLETFYDGYNFRSRMEARWAVFFNELGIRYIYEPVGVKIAGVVGYLPDFYLPDLEIFIEVKAVMLDSFDLYKAKSLCKGSQKPVLILDGDPAATYYNMYIPDKEHGTSVVLVNIFSDGLHKGVQRKGNRAYKEYGEKGQEAVKAIHKARQQRFGVYENENLNILND